MAKIPVFTTAHVSELICRCRTAFFFHLFSRSEQHDAMTQILTPQYTSATLQVYYCRQAKEVNAPKREEQVFFMTQLPAGTTLVEHEARFVLGSTAVLRNSREIKICLNAELPTHRKQIF